MTPKLLTIEQKLRKKFEGFKFSDKYCEVHKHNSYVPCEDHHIWPQEWHGPTTKENLVRVCSNGHGEIHYFLDLLLATGKSNLTDAVLNVPPDIRGHFGNQVKRYAAKGFVGIMHAQVTPDGLIIPDAV